MAEVIIYYTVFEDIDQPIDEKWIHALPASLAAEILLYKKQDDINRLTAGKYLLKKSLTDQGFDPALFSSYQIDEMGKPFIEKFHPFNISHSGQVVACAVLLEQGNIGIDVERIREIEITKFNKQFSPPEMMQILTANDPQKKFFDYWTMKEAVMKADGRGMRIPLHSIRLQQDHATIDDKECKWNLHTLHLHESVKAHICTDLLLKNIFLKKWELIELLH